MEATSGFCQSLCLLRLTEEGPRRVQTELSKWRVEAISETYRTKGLPMPFIVKCHSTRSVSAFWEALRGVPLEDTPQTWALPCTFARFYRVNVAALHTVAADVLPRPAAC